MFAMRQEYLKCCSEFGRHLFTDIGAWKAIFGLWIQRYYEPSTGTSRRLKCGKLLLVPNLFYYYTIVSLFFTGIIGYPLIIWFTTVLRNVLVAMILGPSSIFILLVCRWTPAEFQVTQNSDTLSAFFTTRRKWVKKMQILSVLSACIGTIFGLVFTLQ